MTKAERIAKARLKYAKDSKEGQPPVSNNQPNSDKDKQKSLWSMFIDTLKKNKESLKQAEVPKEPSPPIIKAEPPAPVSTSAVSPQMLELIAQKRQAREQRRQAKINKLNQAIYDEAIRKNAVTESSLESIQLKNFILTNPAEVKDFLKNIPEPAVTQKQNIEKESASLRRKQLQKSVQYVNPSEDKNNVINN